MSSKDFDRRCREIHKLVDWFVRIRLQGGEKERDSEGDDGKKKFILLDELAKETQNPLELRNESLSLLFAGRDTAGALLGWVFYFLARHERVFRKLRSIVLETFGPSITGKIDFAQLKACQYMLHTINECFRVAAVIPLNERVAVCDTTLPRGGGPDGSQPIFIPKGRQILIATYAMQHRADIWGEDVEEFKPERWEGRKVGWEFIPFGAGPRSCLGRKLNPPAFPSSFPPLVPALSPAHTPTSTKVVELYVFWRLANLCPFHAIVSFEYRLDLTRWPKSNAPS